MDKQVGIISWLVLLFLSIVWGSSFILIKKALLAFTPDVMGSLRICVSSVAFLPVLYYHRNSVDWSKWRQFLLVGITGSGLPAYLYATAQTEISSSLSGMLNSLTPIWTLLIGLFVFKIPASWQKFTGVIIGLFGAAGLLYVSNVGEHGGNNWYGLFIVIGTLCYATSVNAVKHYFQETKAIVVSSVSFVMIGIPAFIFMLFFTPVVDQFSGGVQVWWSMGAILLLALFGTMLASVIFYKLVQNTNAVFASSVAYFMPIIALAWGVIDGENIGWFHIFGLILILSGVYLIKKEPAMKTFKSSISKA